MFKDPDILNFPRSAPSSAQLSEKVTLYQVDLCLKSLAQTQ